MPSYIPQIIYIIAAILIIVGLKRLSSPATARVGNQIAAVGVALALAITILNSEIQDYLWIGVGVVIGGIAGYIMARRVQMTAMPQMVALFNGMGGGAAALVSASEYLHSQTVPGTSENFAVLLTTLLGLIIGSLSIAGSVVAFGKLQGLISGRPITYGGQQVVNGILAVVIVGFSLYLLFLQTNSVPAFVAIAAAALILGVAVVLPIGGADMPVVISLLNSFTGLAVAMTGFVLNNPVLIISGTLVGASGTLLTQLMSKAMNRSLANVLFGAFGSAGGPAAAGVAGGAAAVPLRETSAEDAGTLLAYSRSVIVVPGYGLAVAQAQQTVRELAEVLEKRGVDVRYAIHPVAGRMPGHMNVLLAEANVPYTQLKEMDEINSEFPQADVALVIGANDVTNPAARTNPQSPIFGMPILNVDQAQNIIVIKRGRGTGFAGIENDLFANPKTMMLFGDAKDALSRLVSAVKAA
ncbi:MAG TPA: NAD(P)(+) transhydrogenase (Re/Si-specific) subunit beta [Chloroflexia bacterium]|nr:NAD(P)(+) transhydrogenase (Re/Si-specific) subunit beta [Chloroflexia bacterium]